MNHFRSVSPLFVMILGLSLCAIGPDAWAGEVFAHNPDKSPRVVDGKGRDGVRAILKDSAGALVLRKIADATVSEKAVATDLNLWVVSNGSEVVAALPGAAIDYEIIGLLSDDANEGLALVGLNLVYDGGDLEHTDLPTGEPTPGCDNPMINFKKPWGITNPDSPCPPSCGFGGTLSSGILLQVGGAQNTINNTIDNAPFPLGPVLAGVAKPAGCGSTVLVTGTVYAPLVDGTYTLAATEVFANVIIEGETGAPTFWATEAAGVGEVRPLTIIVGVPVTPAASHWALLVLALLVMSAGTIMLRRRECQRRCVA